MKLYSELAKWWPLLSAPEDYEEESRLYREIIEKYNKNIITVLELGSGGGNNASFLKKFYRMTLSDISPQMIDVSRKLNPECKHIIGDMRELDLNRTFDLVFIHDAIMYMTSETDLLKVFMVASRHLPKNGLLFIAPDFFKETFKPSTDHGGHDGEERSLRYLEWCYDDNPNDTIIETQFAYILKEESGQINFEHDYTVNGIFSKKTWEDLLKQAGFKTYFEEINHSELEPGSYIGIVAVKQ